MISTADAYVSKEEFNRLLKEEPLPYPSAMKSSAASVDTWPPIWKPLEEVSHYSALRPYIQLEESIKHDDSQKTLVRILKRVRKTNGYGLNCDHEKLRGYPLSWWPLTTGLCDDMMRDTLGFVIAKMNALAESHGYGGYVYELSEFENVVHHPRLRALLLSFSVKEYYCGQVKFKDVRANVWYAGGPGNYDLFDLSWRKRRP